MAATGAFLGLSKRRKSFGPRRTMISANTARPSSFLMPNRNETKKELGASRWATLVSLSLPWVSFRRAEAEARFDKANLNAMHQGIRRIAGYLGHAGSLAEVRLAFEP